VFVKALKGHERRNISKHARSSVWQSDVDFYVLHERLSLTLSAFKNGDINEDKAVDLLTTALAQMEHVERVDEKPLRNLLRALSAALTEALTVSEFAQRIIVTSKIRRSRWTQTPVSKRVLEAVVPHFNAMIKSQAGSEKRLSGSIRRDRTTHGLNHSPGDLGFGIRPF
jgi:hypothetical protein